MRESQGGRTPVGRAYRKRASHYDAFVRLFNLFRSFGFDIPAWRREAIQTLKCSKALFFLPIPGFLSGIISAPFILILRKKTRIPLGFTLGVSNPSGGGHAALSPCRLVELPLAGGWAYWPF